MGMRINTWWLVIYCDKQDVPKQAEYCKVSSNSKKREEHIFWDQMTVIH